MDWITKLIYLAEVYAIARAKPTATSAAANVELIKATVDLIAHASTDIPAPVPLQSGS